MKIVIVGAGNMGGAIACGLMSGTMNSAINLTVIDRQGRNISRLKAVHPNMDIQVGVYDSLTTADVVILAVKPWLIESFLKEHTVLKEDNGRLLLSVAAGISLAQLEQWTSNLPIYRVMPNTAVAHGQSMTFVSSINATKEQDEFVFALFSTLGKTELIDEQLFAAAASLASCGIAYALRYIRAAMEGGVELGFYPNQAKETVIQTLKGAIALLEENKSHPEEEIDKVTTAGGITIKGLNEMEHAGFTSSVINGLKASYLK